MTHDDAVTIVRMIEEYWDTEFGQAGRGMWYAELSERDADVATRAVAVMAHSTGNARVRRPDIAQFLEAYRSVRESDAREEALGERFRQKGDRHFGIPTWVYVWGWARSHRNPPLDADTRLPQENWDPELEAPLHVLEAHGRERIFMSEEQYEALHQEWIAAGAPRHDPVKAMAAGLGS